MGKRWIRRVVLWMVATALAFRLIYWVLAVCVAIMGLVLLAVLGAADDWENHSTFEQRELARAAKRRQRYARKESARAKDRAIWQRYRPDNDTSR